MKSNLLLSVVEEVSELVYELQHSYPNNPKCIDEFLDVTGLLTPPVMKILKSSTDELIDSLMAVDAAITLYPVLRDALKYYRGHDVRSTFWDAHLSAWRLKQQRRGREVISYNDHLCAIYALLQTAAIMG